MSTYLIKGAKPYGEDPADIVVKDGRISSIGEWCSASGWACPYATTARTGSGKPAKVRSSQSGAVSTSAPPVADAKT